MATRKIGELLVSKGLLSDAQLEKALKAQLIFGGHLGTILLEMGFIKEESLGEALSEVSGVPYAPPEVFEGLDETLIRIVPARLVEEFQLVPIGTKNRDLHVAMVNPRDLNALDALNLALNMKIVPWIAPESRIMQAMERYYGIPRRLRFLANPVNEQQKSAAIAGPAGSAAPESASKPAAEAAGVEAGTVLGEEFGYGKNWKEIAESLDEPVEQADGSPGAPRPRQHSALGELAEALCRADHRTQAADATVRYAANTLSRCLLMGVRGETANLWASHRIATPKKWAYQVSPDGIFRLLEGDSSFRGALPKDERFRGFYTSLRIDPPAELLLVPVHVNDRLVAMFYGDGGPGGRVTSDARQVLLGLRMFTMSLGLLMTKRRIRDMEELSREAAGPPRHDSGR